MKKRIFSLLMVVCVLTSLMGFTGFAAKKAAVEEPYTINVSYPIYAGVPSDMPKVVEKLNEITLKTINCKIYYQPVSFFTMANTYALQATSGEKSDLIMVVTGEAMANYAGSKLIKPIDEKLLKQYGPDLIKGEGATLASGKYQGKQYCIPTKDKTINGNGIQFLNDILKKYGINPGTIKSLNDLDKVFEKVHKGEPNMQIFNPASMSYYTLNYDDIGGGFGVLMNGGLDNTKVVNLYKTKEYMDMVKKVREWYLKGYISKDIATTTDDPGVLQNAKKLFAVTDPVNFSKDNLAQPVATNSCMLVPPVRKTGTAQTLMWGIPSSCKNPAKVIEFLNLMFKDTSVAALMRYGIEGLDYRKLYAGVIDNSPGVKSFNYSWAIFGDFAKFPVTKAELNGAAGGSIVKYKMLMDNWNKKIKNSKALGFMFDPTNYKTELAAMNVIYNQYSKLIETGSVDPVSTLKEMNDKLDAAGAQKVIDAKQKQLNAWLKTQK